MGNTVTVVWQSCFKIPTACDGSYYRGEAVTTSLKWKPALDAFVSSGRDEPRRRRPYCAIPRDRPSVITSSIVRDFG